MGGIGRAVLVVLGLVEGGEGAVVHPHVLALLHGHGIRAVVGLRLPEVDVPDDDVARADEEHADPVHHEAVGAVDAQVGDFLDVEPGMGLGEVTAVSRTESTAEPDGYGRMIPLLLLLGAVEQPGLEGLAVVEMEDVVGRRGVTAGHIRRLGIAGHAVERHLAGLGRIRAHEFCDLARLDGLVGILARIAAGRTGGIDELVEAEAAGRIDLHRAFIQVEGKDGRAVRADAAFLGRFAAVRVHGHAAAWIAVFARSGNRHLEDAGGRCGEGEYAFRQAAAAVRLDVAVLGPLAVLRTGSVGQAVQGNAPAGDVGVAVRFGTGAGRLVGKRRLPFRRGEVPGIGGHGGLLLDVVVGQGDIQGRHRVLGENDVLRQRDGLGDE